MPSSNAILAPEALKQGIFEAHHRVTGAGNVLAPATFPAAAANTPGPAGAASATAPPPPLPAAATTTATTRGQQHPALPSEFRQAYGYGAVDDTRLELLLDRLAAAAPESLGPTFYPRDASLTPREAVRRATAYTLLETLWVPAAETPSAARESRNRDLVLRLVGVVGGPDLLDTVVALRAERVAVTARRVPSSDAMEVDGEPLALPAMPTPETHRGAGTIDLSDPAIKWVLVHEGRPEPRTASEPLDHRRVRAVPLGPLGSDLDCCSCPASWKEASEWVQDLGYQRVSALARRGYAFFQRDLAVMTIFKVCELNDLTPVTTKIPLMALIPRSECNAFHMIEVTTLPARTSSKAPGGALAVQARQWAEQMVGGLGTIAGDVDPLAMRDRVPYRT
ncbi:hypothetical protein BC828DRAFT_399201 [Blastocladiella britannica]|nr:hypothetical protein BC828DRAFT_399201 [Blastocladiella britannica]